MTSPLPADHVEPTPPRAETVAPRDDRAFALLLTTAYAALATWKILHHVMWRDEWRAWMIARDSGSIAELIANLRYDGHPGLWYAILFGLSRVTRDPVAMKLAHVAIATAAVWVVARHAPLTRLQRVLFALGYFAFFEYATISRGYGLGMLLTFAACAVFARHGPRRVITLSVLLALLANTSVYGTMLAGTFALTYAVAKGRRLPPAFVRPTAVWHEALAAVIFWTGLLAAVAMMFPGPDRAMIDGPWFGVDVAERVAQTLASVWRSYVPLPRARVNFWNTNVLDALPWVAAALSVLLLVNVITFLRGRPAAMTFFLVGTAVILVATGFKFAGALRHHGHLFIVLVLAYWIARVTGGARRGFDVVVTVLLFAHVLAGVAASAIDLRVPFSASRETADYIRREKLDHLPLIGHVDTTVSSVSGCLDRPIYYLVERDVATFNTQNSRQRYPLFYEKMLDNIDRIVRAGGGEALLIASEPIDLPPGWLMPIATFDESIVPDERYTLYRVRRAPVAP